MFFRITYVAEKTADLSRILKELFFVLQHVTFHFIFVRFLQFQLNLIDKQAQTPRTVWMYLSLTSGCRITWQEGAAGGSIERAWSWSPTFPGFQCWDGVVVGFMSLFLLQVYVIGESDAPAWRLPLTWYLIPEWYLSDYRTNGVSGTAQTSCSISADLDDGRYISSSSDQCCELAWQKQTVETNHCCDTIVFPAM